MAALQLPVCQTSLCKHPKLPSKIDVSTPTGNKEHEVLEASIKRVDFKIISEVISMLHTDRL